MILKQQQNLYLELTLIEQLNQHKTNECINIQKKGKKTTFVNNTRWENMCLAQLSRRMAAWLLLTFFIWLHNQLSSAM